MAKLLSGCDATTIWYRNTVNVASHRQMPGGRRHRFHRPASLFACSGGGGRTSYDGEGLEVRFCFCVLTAPDDLDRRCRSVDCCPAQQASSDHRRDGAAARAGDQISGTGSSLAKSITSWREVATRAVGNRAAHSAVPRPWSEKRVPQGPATGRLNEATRSETGARFVIRGLKRRRQAFLFLALGVAVSV
jgi:hypothetical protein